MTRLQDNLNAEAEFIAAVVAEETGCTTCKRNGILEHGICQNCWLDAWQNNTQCICGDFKLSHGIAIASTCSECECKGFKPSVTFTDFKAFYGMTSEEIAAHKVL